MTCSLIYPTANRLEAGDRILGELPNEILEVVNVATDDDGSIYARMADGSIWSWPSARVLKVARCLTVGQQEAA